MLKLETMNSRDITSSISSFFPRIRNVVKNNMDKTINVENVENTTLDDYIYIMVDDTAKKILKSDLWFWSSEWQRKEMEVDVKNKNNPELVFNSMDDLISFLDEE